MILPGNSSTHKLTRSDILHGAFDEISAIAATHGIDWNKVVILINQGQTECSKGIAIDRHHDGAVKAWLRFQTTRKGQEYPLITFNNFKGGGSKGVFNGYQWLKDQQGLISPRPFIPAQKPKKTKVVSANQWQQNRFNRFKLIFDSLPVLIDTTGTNLAKKGFTIDNLPPGFVVKRGFDSRGGYVVYALGNEGGITCFQKIYDEKFTDSSGKNRDKDIIGPKKGAYVLLGEPQDKVELAEGFTTALSIYASGKFVAVALDAFNLIHVAKVLNKSFVVGICADNDLNGHSLNTGIIHGLKAAQAIGAEHIVYPEMDNLKCDWNDLYQALGIDAVRYQLANNRIYVATNQAQEECKKHYETYINEKFLPNDIFKDGVNIVKSTYGTGKTEAVARYLEKNPGESVLYIAHLQTLCGQAASRLSLENYGDHKFNLHEHSRLSICVNSIFKLQDNGAIPHYDVVVIDEVEQLLVRMTGTGKDSIEHKPLVFSVLQRLVKNAKKVICLDADISTITFDFVGCCRPNEAFNILINSFIKADKKLFIYKNEADVLKLAKAAVANGEPVLFATNSLTKSEELEAMIDCDGKRVINSKTSGLVENRIFLDDVNNQCKNDMLTVVSPSVSTGFSIEAGHYRHNFGIFSNLVNTPFDCLQQLERDRVTLKKHIYIPSGRRDCKAKSFEAAHDHNMEHCDGYGNVVCSDPIYSRLVANVNESRIALMSDFWSSFIGLAKAKGYEVVVVDETVTKTEVEKTKTEKAIAKVAISEARISATCEAESVDAEQYQKIKKKTRKTPDEVAQIERYEIEEFYTAPVTPDLVRDDRNGKRREQIKAAKLATATLDNVKIEQKNNATNKFVEDVNYVLIRHLLLRNVLKAVGINPDLKLTKLFYTKDDLVDFIDWADSHRGLLDAIWPTMPTRKEIETNPYRYVGSLLRSMNILQHRVVQKIEGNARCVGYAIDRPALEWLHFFLFNKKKKISVTEQPLREAA